MRTPTIPWLNNFKPRLLTEGYGNMLSQKRRFLSYPRHRVGHDFDPNHLMVEAKKGKLSAFDALYQVYLRPVLAYLQAHNRNREIAEDISQTVFMKAFCGLSGWRNEGKDPLAYFFTIAKNTLSDFRKKERRIPFSCTECEQIADTDISAEIMLIHVQSIEILKRAMNNLTKDQREVLIKKYFDELSYSEISRTTGKSPDSVRQHHSRAIKAMRKIFSRRSPSSNKLTIINYVSSKLNSDVLMKSEMTMRQTRKPCRRA